MNYISDYTAFPPARLVGYIVYGDDNFNTFTSNPSSTPNYVYSWNVLDWNQQTYTWSVDRNGYYFIVIAVQTEHDFHFVCYNASDYDLSNGRYVETVGIPVRQNFDRNNNNIILCFVGSSHSKYRSIHVILNYNLRITVVVGISNWGIYFKLLCPYYFIFCVLEKEYLQQLYSQKHQH